MSSSFMKATPNPRASYNQEVLQTKNARRGTSMDPRVLGYYCRLTSPRLAQLQDLRKSPESVTKTSSGLMDGGAYMSEARS